MSESLTTRSCRCCGSPLIDPKPVLNEDAVCVDCPRCGELKIDRMEWDSIHSPWKDQTSKAEPANDVETLHKSV